MTAQPTPTAAASASACGPAPRPPTTSPAATTSRRVAPRRNPHPEAIRACLDYYIKGDR